MKIKITHPIPKRADLKVGYVFDIPPKLAKEILENDWGTVKEKEAKDGDG